MVWLLMAWFFVILGLTLYATQSRKRFLGYLTKPLLTLVLLGLYLTGAKTVELPVVLALAGGFAGDVFLMLPEKMALFAWGLASFLAGHLCYLFAFLGRPGALAGLEWWLVLPAAAYLAAGVGLYRRLAPFLAPASHHRDFRENLGLGKFKPFVTAYLVTILAMGTASLTTIKTAQGLGFLSAVAGALLFVVSDSLIAFARFTGAKPRAGTVMVTYGLAQFFLTLYFTLGTWVG